MRAPEDSSEKYIRSAYVFPVLQNGSEVGYITAGAHRSMEPILEYSTEASPIKKTSKVAQQTNSTTGRRIYEGGVSYGMELTDNKVVEPHTAKTYHLGTGSPNELAFSSVRSEERWEAARSENYGAEKEYSTDDVSIMDDSVSDVPCWTTNDDLDGGDADETEIGYGDDEWDDWDGCTPIAASMIIGYYEGVSEYEGDTREAIIDRLHIKMETNASGGTAPFVLDLDGDVSSASDLIRDPMSEGIEDYTEGSHTYDAFQHVNPGIEFVLEEIENNDRPYMLNMSGGGRANDYPSDKSEYGNHSVTVVGYQNDGTDIASELEIHDTWNSNSHVLSYANWFAHSCITVET